jgi:hypothetical protein
VSWNVPDDWNSHWRYCDRHKHRYHGSEWCVYCEDEDSQCDSEPTDQIDEEIANAFEDALNDYTFELRVIGLKPEDIIEIIIQKAKSYMPREDDKESNDGDDDCSVLCFCRECLN